MGSDRVSRDVWRFGDVEFDKAQARLTVAGRVVELNRNSQAILSVLLQHAGAEVSKEDLLEAGWPDRIVHENSLAKAIGRLRAALGEQGEALESIYGRGYRLKVDLAPAVPQRSEQEQRPIQHRRRAAYAAAGVAAIVAALGLTAFLDGPGAAENAPLVIGEPPDALRRILWVDDNPGNNRQERRYLEQRNIAVYAVTDSEDALVLLAMHRYDAVISDMGRNGRPLAGIGLVEEMRERGDATPFYFYTILPSETKRRLVAEAGAQGVATTSRDLYRAILRPSNRLLAREEGDTGRGDARE